jgi:transketolase
MNSKQLVKKIRIKALNMVNRGGGAHIGSILSVSDIIAVLYCGCLNLKIGDPNWPERDRFILSKGHAGAAIYIALAEIGVIDKSKLESYYLDGSDLSGHVSHKGVPGVELSTGALGHGLSVGSGMALGAKLDGNTHKVFVVMSDGECDEGSNWEAILFASHKKLDNLVAIIDYNKIQSLASVSETLELEPFREKWESFGWSVREVDGHDHDQLKKAVRDLPFEPSKPCCIIAHTTKGKGVSFMENSVLWHYRVPVGVEFQNALKELEGLE